MTRAHLSIGAAVAVAAGSPAAAIAAHHHHHKHKAKPKVVKVDVQDDMYSDTSVKLHKGSEIKWDWDAANYDSHNVKVLKAPKGAHKFASPSGTTGITYKHVFTKVGTYQLYCTIHPDSMTMTVVVKPEGALMGSRRGFLASAGGTLLCTLAGHEVRLDRHADVEQLASGVPVPPKVARQIALPTATPVVNGTKREYWIRAERMKWNIIPTGRDEMMDQKVKGKHTFAAYGYRAYTANFAAPIGPASIPGPLIEAQTGDTVVINFQNTLKVPVTMHPHGIFYPNEMDGAYKGKFTDPGGFVQKGRTFQYQWEARPGTEGFWLYHDHGPMDPIPLHKGLFGPLIIRKAGAARPDAEFFTVLHSFPPLATGLTKVFSCINGHSYAGNTPTLQAKVGQKVAFHVYALDNDFHTFHIHGHRWADQDGGATIDTKVLGPAESFTASFTEDNPGRWFYHCHVFSHLHMGMNGWYIVS